MPAIGPPTTETLLSRSREFSIPGGNDVARLTRAVPTPEKGQMRMSPEARWIPFTAEQVIDSTCSSFHWKAKLDPAKTISPTVTDRYKDGQGRRAVKLMGIVAVKKLVGQKGIGENYSVLWPGVYSTTRPWDGTYWGL
jgi:hypothetical protein